MKCISAFTERYPWTVQFVKFGLVGVSNTLVYWVCYSLLVRFGCHYALANGIGFVISVLNSFLWNSLFVFRKDDGKNDEEKTDAGKKRSTAAALVKTFISYALTGLVLQTFLLHLLIDIAGISAYIAPLLCVCVTTPLNFLLNKFWTFR